MTGSRPVTAEPPLLRCRLGSGVQYVLKMFACLNMAPLHTCILVLLVSTSVSGAKINLQADRLSLQYRSRLSQALTRFGLWTSKRKMSLSGLAADPERANAFLIDYIQSLFDHGRPFGLAKETILALQTVFRHLKGRLRAAWDSVSSWRLRRPVRSRVPMRLEILLGLCRYGCLAAARLDQGRSLLWLAWVTSLQAGFWGLLRPKELFGLRRSCVRLPGRFRVSSQNLAVLTVLEPKNRAFMGRVQVRLVRDPACVRWLEWWCKDMLPEQLIWPATRRTWVGMLNTALRFLGLEDVNLTPGSLRAGGATFLLEQGIAVSNIRFAGGWASDHSLAAYLQEAEAAATLLDLSARTARRLAWLVDELPFLASPPSAPAVAFA